MKIHHLSDEELHLSALHAKNCEIRSVASVIEHLAEVQKRKLHLKRGHTNLYQYAIKELKYSEGAAHRRISAAKLILEFPDKLESITNGSLSLGVAAEAWTAFRERRNRPQVQAKSNSQRNVSPQQSWILPASKVPNTVVQAESLQKPITREVKREILDRLENKNRTQARREILRLAPVPQGASDFARPKGNLSIGRNWNKLETFLSNDELAQFQRLIDLLSHRLPSTRPEDLILFLLREGLMKHDPELKQNRIDAVRMRQPSATHAPNPHAPNPHAPDSVPREIDRQSPSQFDAPRPRGEGAPQHFELSPKTGLCNGATTTITAAAATTATAAAATTAATTTAATAATTTTATATTTATGHRSSDPSRLASIRDRSRNRKRIPIPQPLRRRIWIRDHGRCTYGAHHDPKLKCGSKRFLDIDHIIPVSKGGGNQMENLRLVCASHNRNRHLIE